MSEAVLKSSNEKILNFLIFADSIEFSECGTFVYCFTSQFVFNRMYVKSWYAESFGTYLHITLF